jgi:hypothetical protein
MCEERPFGSSKMLCRHFRIGKAKWLRILQSKLGLKKCHLRRVQYTLSINEKSKRGSYSKLLLTARMEQKATGFQRITNGDELWFVLDYPRGSAWAASRDELPQRIKQKNDTKSV